MESRLLDPYFLKKTCLFILIRQKLLLLPKPILEDPCKYIIISILHN